MTKEIEKREVAILSDVFRCRRVVDLKLPIRELMQPRRRRKQERHNFAYLTVKNNSFARFARACLIFGHFIEVLVLSAT